MPCSYFGSTEPHALPHFDPILLAKPGFNLQAVSAREHGRINQPGIWLNAVINDLDLTVPIYPDRINRELHSLHVDRVFPYCR